MAFKFLLASSSLYPPDKNIIPTQDGNTDLDNAVAVLKAISSHETFCLSTFVDPGVTMLGFRSMPSKNTLFSERAAKTA